MRAPSFPPQNHFDIASYDEDEIFQAYLEFQRDDPAPGDNHSPAYRWGWQNCLRDAQHKDDGFDWVRHQYLQAQRVAA